MGVILSMLLILNHILSYLTSISLTTFLITIISLILLLITQHQLNWLLIESIISSLHRFVIRILAVSLIVVFKIAMQEVSRFSFLIISDIFCNSKQNNKLSQNTYQLYQKSQQLTPGLLYLVCDRVRSNKFRFYSFRHLYKYILFLKDNIL